MVVPRTVTPSPGWGSTASTAALPSVVPAATRAVVGRPSLLATGGWRGPSTVPGHTTRGSNPDQGWLPMAPLQSPRTGSQPNLRLLCWSPQRHCPSNHPVSHSPW